METINDIGVQENTSGFFGAFKKYKMVFIAAAIIFVITITVITIIGIVLFISKYNKSDTKDEAELKDEAEIKADEKQKEKEKNDLKIINKKLKQSEKEFKELTETEISVKPHNKSEKNVTFNLEEHKPKIEILEDDTKDETPIIDDITSYDEYSIDESSE